jgi:hypothetical protein
VTSFTVRIRILTNWTQFVNDTNSRLCDSIRFVRSPIDNSLKQLTNFNQTTNRRCQEWTTDYVRRLADLGYIEEGAIDIVESRRDPPSHDIGLQGAGRGQEKAAKLLLHNFQLKDPHSQRHRKLLPNRLPLRYGTLLIINTDTGMVLNGSGNRGKANACGAASVTENIVTKANGGASLPTRFLLD